MTRQFLRAGLALVLVLLLPSAVLSVDAEDARSVGCLPKGAVETASAACASCHKEDAVSRYEKEQSKACVPYCMSCHKKDEMERHHTVGTELTQMPETALHLSAGSRIACATCHDMSRARYDSVRWKATSLFSRMFRNEVRYKTYFLTMRNDAGQLCLTCH